MTNHETGESKAYLIPYGSRIKIQDGAELEAGDELTEGSVNPHDILKIKGLRAVQDYMIQEVQRVYRLQGVDINDKHIEVIVRQMLKKVRVEEAGDTEFLPGTNGGSSGIRGRNQRARWLKKKRAGYRRADHAWYHQGMRLRRIPSSPPHPSRRRRKSSLRRQSKEKSIR